MNSEIGEVESALAPEIAVFVEESLELANIVIRFNAGIEFTFVQVLTRSTELQVALDSFVLPLHSPSRYWWQRLIPPRNRIIGVQLWNIPVIGFRQRIELRSFSSIQIGIAPVYFRVCKVTPAHIRAY